MGNRHILDFYQCVNITPKYYEITSDSTNSGGTKGLFCLVFKFFDIIVKIRHSSFRQHISAVSVRCLVLLCFVSDKKVIQQEFNYHEEHIIICISRIDVGLELR